MARSGMNPKTLQHLMGHSDISVTLNVYTHLGLLDAEEELARMNSGQKKVVNGSTSGKKAASVVNF